MTCVDYVNSAVNKVEEVIRGTHSKLTSKTTAPTMKTYEAELYGSPELEGKDTQFF